MARAGVSLGTRGHRSPLAPVRAGLRSRGSASPARRCPATPDPVPAAPWGHRTGGKAPWAAPLSRSAPFPSSLHLPLLCSTSAWALMSLPRIPALTLGSPCRRLEQRRADLHACLRAPRAAHPKGSPQPRVTAQPHTAASSIPGFKPLLPLSQVQMASTAPSLPQMLSRPVQGALLSPCPSQQRGRGQQQELPGLALPPRLPLLAPAWGAQPAVWCHGKQWARCSELSESGERG